ncbi:P-selectin-like [Ciona intestinalis]
MLCKVFFACFIAVVSGCVNLEAPKHGSINCTTTNDVMKCHVACEDWMYTFGEELLTCLPNGEWDNMLPFCHPDYTQCGAKGQRRCPRVTKEDRDIMESFVQMMDFDIKAGIEDLSMKVGAIVASRNSRRNKCSPGFCNYPCFVFHREVARICKKCKIKKVIKCKKSASFFG